MFREWETLAHSVLNGRPPSNLSPEGSEGFAEEETKLLWEPVEMDITK